MSKLTIVKKINLNYFNNSLYFVLRILI